MSTNSDVCQACKNDRVVLIGCCGGRECGCMGQPIDAKHCKACNISGLKLPSFSVVSDYPWFFLDESLHTRLNSDFKANPKSNRWELVRDFFERNRQEVLDKGLAYDCSKNES